MAGNSIIRFSRSATRDIRKRPEFATFICLDWFLRAAALGSRATKVAYTLYGRMKIQETPGMLMSLRTIAHMSGISVRHAHAALRALEAARLVSLRADHGSTTAVTLRIPRAWVAHVRHDMVRDEDGDLCTPAIPPGRDEFTTPPRAGRPPKHFYIRTLTRTHLYRAVAAGTNATFVYLVRYFAKQLDVLEETPPIQSWAPHRWCWKRGNAALIAAGLDPEADAQTALSMRRFRPQRNMP